MINKNNVRMTFTFSKKQAEWIKKCAKNCNLQPSQFIKWLIDKNVGRLFSRMTNLDKQIMLEIDCDRTIIETKENDGTKDYKERDEISKAEWDHLFDELGDEPKQEDENELPF